MSFSFFIEIKESIRLDNWFPFLSSSSNKHEVAVFILKSTSFYKLRCINNPNNTVEKDNIKTLHLNYILNNTYLNFKISSLWLIKSGNWLGLSCNKGWDWQVSIFSMVFCNPLRELKWLLVMRTWFNVFVPQLSVTGLTFRNLFNENEKEYMGVPTLNATSRLAFQQVRHILRF